MFAFDLGGAYFSFIAFLALGLWAIARLARKADKNGEVGNAARTAAKEGIVRVIGRLFK